MAMVPKYTLVTVRSLNHY